MFKNWGVETPFQSEEIQETIKQTNLRIYGVENLLISQNWMKRKY